VIKINLLKKKFLEVFLIFVSILFSYLLLEIGYRAYLWHHYVTEAVGPVVVIDIPDPSGSSLTENDNIYGSRPRNAKIKYKRFLTGGLSSEHFVKTNNLGWVSHYDYAREKSSSEFRIAVVGASLAACVTNSIPWPDVVQRHLNTDTDLLDKLGVKKISVINISTPGASLEHMSKILAPIAARFSPDLTFVNFHVTNLEGRCANVVNTQKPKVYKLTPPFSFKVKGIEVPLICKSGPKELSNPACKVSNTWVAPQGQDLDKIDWTEVKKDVARKLLWHRLILSTKPTLLLELIGRPVIKRPNVEENGQTGPFRLFWNKLVFSVERLLLSEVFIKSALAAQNTKKLLDSLPEKTQEDIHAGVNALTAIGRLNPHTMYAHNSLLFHLNKADPKGIKLQNAFIESAKQEKINIINMDDYLPTERGDLEWEKWYMPDGHFSDYGAEVYGKAVAEVIREFLLKNLELSKEPSVSSVCNPLSLEFARGKEIVEKGDLSSALAVFSNILKIYEEKLALLPKHKPLQCHCIFELYRERASLFEKLKEPEKALADLEAALKLIPNSAQTYSQRAYLFLMMGKWPESISDYIKALEITPLQERGPIYFYRSTAHFHLKDYRSAIEDFNKLLENDPKNISILNLRASAYRELGLLKDALADYNTILDIDPRNESAEKSHKEITKKLKEKEHDLKK